MGAVRESPDAAPPDFPRLRPAGALAPALVAAGDLIVVLEAMKMEQPLTAHKAGTITSLTAEPGATVPTGTVLCEIKD